MTFADAIAFVVGRVVQLRRREVLGAMQRAGMTCVEQRADAMYRALARMLLDTLALAFRAPARVDLDAELKLAVAGGAVVATAHTGSWDATACAVARERPLLVVSKRLSIAWLDRLWQGLRRRRGLSVAHVGAVVPAARAVVAEGGVVAMMIDQRPNRVRGTVVTDFLGAPARVDLAPALLAARLGVPLVVAFPVAGRSQPPALALARVLRPPRRASRAWAERAMVEATLALDSFVRAHPEQWLWLHRRWKDASPDGRAAFRSRADGLARIGSEA